MSKRIVYGRAAYEGFAKAIGSKMGLRVQIEDGASACIDAAGVVRLPGMNTYQTAQEFAVTCSVIVHELAHQFYGSHGLIDPNRSRLEHDCLNAVLDVADETWIDNWFQGQGNSRPGELLTEGNWHALRTNWNAYLDWNNASTHAWKILCMGIFQARIRVKRRWVNFAAYEAAAVGIDAKACWKLLRRAKATKRETGAPTPKRFAKLIALAKQIADLLKSVAPPEGSNCIPSPGDKLGGALAAGSGNCPADCREATESQGQSIADGAGPIGGITSGNGSGSGKEADRHAYQSLHPAVERVAQRIALDGDGIARNEGLCSGPSLAQPYRLMTDGQAMARWDVSDQADGVSVAVLLDCSGSMCHCLSECAGIAMAFAVGMKDCAAVKSFAFGSTVKEVDDFDRVDTMGGTATDKALRKAGEWLATRSGSKWVILITDGEPGDRTATDAACAAVRADGAQVLAIGLGCRFQMAGALCTWADEVNHLAIELDAATRCIEQGGCRG